MRIIFILIAIFLFGAGCGDRLVDVAPSPESDQNIGPGLVPGRGEAQGPALQGQGDGGISSISVLRTDFSQLNPIFRFSAEIPSAWKIEYVPEIEAINVYDPAIPAESAREQSQIFIRYFEANQFLTLSTVEILERESTEVQGHPAVRYEIAKKPGVADFAHQPSWRNARHKLTDVRFTRNSPSTFYVFSYNPALEEQIFEDFLQSIRFHNDAASFVSPLDRPAQCISKKPFGLYVTPENSPV